MSIDFQIGDTIKVDDQHIVGKIVAIHEEWEIIICEIEGEFECPDSHLSFKPYELEIV